MTKTDLVYFKQIGCSIDALKKAGFTAAELKKAGFVANELKSVGFNANELKKDGFNINELKNAGFNVNEMKDAGFDVKDLKNAGFSAGELRNVEVGASELKNAGYSAGELRDAGFSAAEIKSVGFGVDMLKKAGFTKGDLIRSGFEEKAIDDGDFKSGEIGRKGKIGHGIGQVSAGELKKTEYSAKELMDVGFSAAKLKDTGYSAEELRNAGFNISELKEAGFGVDELKKAGFTEADLMKANFEEKKETEKNNQVKNKEDVALRNDFMKNDYEAISNFAKKTKPSLSSKLDNENQLKGEVFGENNGGGVSNQDKRALLLQAQEERNQESFLPVADSNDAIDHNPAVKELNELRKQQAVQLSAQERQDKIRQKQQGMLSQSGDLFSSWLPVSSQQFVQGINEDFVKNGKESMSIKQKNNNETLPIDNKKIYKAGGIFFAVLDTGVNSDEKSPVMATIVEGDLKGAKLLGTFERVEAKVILRFNLLSVDSKNSSVGLNAVAIDPDRAKIALASKVDKHYLLRYGALFASSFISGVGQAYRDAANSVTIKSGTGETINVHGSMNAVKSAIIGFGEVGNKFANSISSLVNTPPTVEVKAGTGIGVLLMSDLSI